MQHYRGNHAVPDGAVAASQQVLADNTKPARCPDTFSAEDSEGLLADGSGASLDWTDEEQRRLDEALERFPLTTHPDPLDRYLQVAAQLPNKTVRDVTLRVQWISRNNGAKRKKGCEETSSRRGKGVKNPNGKHAAVVVDDSAQAGVAQMHTFIAQLLDQNYVILNQFKANMSSFKVTENTELLVRYRDNMVAILHHLNNMPGIMTTMPPLPVQPNLDLANKFLPKQLAPVQPTAGAPPTPGPMSFPPFPFPPPPPPGSLAPPPATASTSHVSGAMPHGGPEAFFGMPTPPGLHHMPPPMMPSLPGLPSMPGPGMPPLMPNGFTPGMAPPGLLPPGLPPGAPHPGLLHGLPPGMIMSRPLLSPGVAGQIPPHLTMQGMMPPASGVMLPPPGMGMMMSSMMMSSGPMSGTHQPDSKGMLMPMHLLGQMPPMSNPMASTQHANQQSSMQQLVKQE